MNNAPPDPEEAKNFVMNRKMSRKEIKLVRRMMKIGNFLPGFKGAITPEVKEHIEKILLEKEKQL